MRTKGVRFWKKEGGKASRTYTATRRLPPEEVLWKKGISPRHVVIMLPAIGAVALLVLYTGVTTFFITATVFMGALVGGAVLAYLASYEYCVTSYRVYARYGLLGYKTTEAYLDKVTGVEIQQSLFDRILGVGNVVITVDGYRDNRIVFKGVNSPGKVKDIINDAVYKNKAWWYR